MFYHDGHTERDIVYDYRIEGHADRIENIDQILAVLGLRGLKWRLPDPNSGTPNTTSLWFAFGVKADSTAPGKLKKVKGRYLGAWKADPVPPRRGRGSDWPRLEHRSAALGVDRSYPLPCRGAPWERWRPVPAQSCRRDMAFTTFIYNAAADRYVQTQGCSAAAGMSRRAWLHRAISSIGRATRAIQCCAMAVARRDARFASNPFVVRNGKLWGMYYFGLDLHGKACEMLALGR